ncbi:YbgA family protein [Nocardiopsis coralliicola]
MTARSFAPEAEPRPRIGVSSCLLGEPVRYNGGHCRHRFLSDSLDPLVDWVRICPEDEIGLGVPRETLHLERDDGDPDGPARVVGTKSGDEHTAELSGVADAHRAEIAGLDGYVLKNKSPSCGLYGLPVFSSDPGASGRRVDGKGRGAFARRLAELFPDLPMEEEGRLSDEGLRDHFVERVFAHARVRELFDGAWRPRDLVAFHSRHKLQVMAHSPEAYRALGRIVADAGGAKDPAERDRIAAEYRTGLHDALAARITPGRHENALQHAFGMVSDHLDDSRRHSILAAIDAYRAGTVPLTVPVELIRHHCAAEGVTWAAEQTYLAPFPASLGLRNSLVRR